MNIPTPDQASKISALEISEEEKVTLDLLEIPQHIKMSGGEKICWIPKFFVIDGAGYRREFPMCANPYAISQASNILKPRGWILSQERLYEDEFHLVLTPDPKRKVDLEDDLLPPSPTHFRNENKIIHS